MSFQWMKRKAKNFEGKKDNCKVNDRIQKLISDLKSKRESLASVQTGFPSSVASFVTNTWMPSVHGGEKKKPRWPSMSKKGSSKPECPVRGSDDLQSEICVDPQSVGQFSADPQSGSEISEPICSNRQPGGLFSEHLQSEDDILEQICRGPASAGRFGDDPQFIGQFSNETEGRGQFGNDTHSLERFGNDPQSRGQFGNGVEYLGRFCNDPQSVGVVHEQNSKDQIVKEVSSVGQLDICSPVSEGPARLCPLCKELLVVVLILAVSLSVVMDVKKAAVGVTAIVYLLVRVLFRKQETESLTQCFSARNCIVSNLSPICREIGVRLGGAVAGLLTYKNDVKSEVFPLHGTVTVSCSDSTKEVCKGIQCSKLYNSDVNRDPRKRKAQVQKSILGRGTFEECGLEKIGAKGLKFSSALGSSVLIVVLVGLMGGRFPAFVFALAWFLLVKLVQIVEGGKNILASNKGKKVDKFAQIH